MKNILLSILLLIFSNCYSQNRLREKSVMGASQDAKYYTGSVKGFKYFKLLNFFERIIFLNIAL
jgi:hypothetical protein